MRNPDTMPDPDGLRLFATTERPAYFPKNLNFGAISSFVEVLKPTSTVSRETRHQEIAMCVQQIIEALLSLLVGMSVYKRSANRVMFFSVAVSNNICRWSAVSGLAPFSTSQMARSSFPLRIKICNAVISAPSSSTPM